MAGGLAVAATLALLVAPRASSEPDGLERVAEDEGFAAQTRDHALADAPTADYGVRGVDHEGLATGLAGVLGIVVTFAAVAGGLALLRRAGSGTGGAAPPGGPAALSGLRDSPGETSSSGRGTPGGATSSDRGTLGEATPPGEATSSGSWPASPSPSVSSGSRSAST